MMILMKSQPGHLLIASLRSIINADRSVTGRYPARGAYRILKAGIPILDHVGPDIFDRIAEGDNLKIVDDCIYQDTELIGRRVSG